MTLVDELCRSVGTRYAAGEVQRNSPAVDVSGGRSPML